jgi:hypothetical protein
MHGHVLYHGLAAMSLRAKLIRQLAELDEEDVRALLGLVERLRAKQAPTPSSEPGPPDGAKLHPERFGTLPGSVQFLGDVESPVADPELWTLPGQAHATATAAPVTPDRTSQ